MIPASPHRPHHTRSNGGLSFIYLHDILRRLFLGVPVGNVHGS
jgi:hypothetical protein